MQPQNKKIIEIMKCNYCNNDCLWVENKYIYGKNYGKSFMIWLCEKCDAYVGCHNNTKKPLGTLANKELRLLRKRAKNIFINKLMGGNWSCDRKTKTKAYKILNNHFKKEFHFGSSSISECKNVIKLMKDL